MRGLDPYPVALLDAQLGRVDRVDSHTRDRPQLAAPRKLTMLRVEVHRDTPASGHDDRVLGEALGVGYRQVRRLHPGGQEPLGVVGEVRFHGGRPYFLLHGRRHPARLPVGDTGADRVVQTRPHLVACAHGAGLVASVGAPLPGVDFLGLPPAVLLERFDVLVPRLVLGGDVREELAMALVGGDAVLHMPVGKGPFLVARARCSPCC